MYRRGLITGFAGRRGGGDVIFYTFCMRTIFLWLVVLMAGQADGQVLGGIFSQGATELKEYAQQIATLTLMIGRLEKGYQIIEGGEDSIGGAAGGEYALHQAYFVSLAAVNPAVSRMSQVGEILTMESAMVSGMGAAVKRWQASGMVTSEEMGVVGQVYTEMVAAGGQIAGELKDVLADREWVMGDGERMSRVIQLRTTLAEFSALVGAFLSGTDLLVMRRKGE